MVFLKRITRELQFLLLFLCFAMQQIRDTSSEEDNFDYYWRDYTGVLPSDAVPGGIDKSGNPTYIGQVYKSSGLMPATIYRGSKIVLYAAGRKTYRTERYVKILCSQNQQKLQWIPTKNEESHLLTNCHLVIGGTEGGYVINIGRVTYEMETIIGKVFDNTTPWKGLHIPHKDTEVDFFSYEILTYNCRITHQCGGNISFIDLRMA